MNNYGVLAIDLAKTVFQVCKTDNFGAVNRKRLKEILILEKISLRQQGLKRTILKKVSDE